MRERTLVGAEEGAQRLIAERLAAHGFRVGRVEIDPPVEQATPPGATRRRPTDGRTCVVGRIDGSGGARSLHLSGHVDVVPVEQPGQWEHDPWGGEVAGGTGVGPGRRAT